MSISVGIPVRDGDRYLAAALDSVLDQVPAPDEVVVVDDGSTDATPEVLEGYGRRIRWVRQPPRGHAATMNRLLALMQGDRLAFNDADDLWTPGRLAVLAGALDGPDLEAVFGWVQQFGSPELPAAALAGVRIDARPQLSYLLTTALVRRSLVDRVGLLDESLSAGANIDWISRARHAGMRAHVVESVVSRRRIHDQNMSRRQQEDKKRTLVRIMRAHRRRLDSSP